jgi:hypothetical protein
MYAACCFCPILTELQFSRQILTELPHMKLGENLSKGSRAAPCERMCGQTDIAKLVVAFRKHKKTGNDKMVAILRIKLQLSLHQVFVVSRVYSTL